MNDSLLLTMPVATLEAFEGDAPPLDPAPEGPAAVNEPAPRRGFFRRVRDALASFFEWVFGAIALVIGLAILSATPILQLLSFGYLLESGARVARSGRLR